MKGNSNSNIQSFDAILDAKYGAPGTDQRTNAEKNALAYYSGVLLENNNLHDDRHDFPEEDCVIQ